MIIASETASSAGCIRPASISSVRHRRIVRNRDRQCRRIRVPPSLSVIVYENMSTRRHVRISQLKTVGTRQQRQRAERRHDRKSYDAASNVNAKAVASRNAVAQQRRPPQAC